ALASEIKVDARSIVEHDLRALRLELVHALVGPEVLLHEGNVLGEVALNVSLRIDVLNELNSPGEKLVTVGVITVVAGIHHVKNRLFSFLAYEREHLVGKPSVEHALDRQETVVAYDESARGRCRNTRGVFRRRVVRIHGIDAGCELPG